MEKRNLPLRVLDIGLGVGGLFLGGGAIELLKQPQILRGPDGRLILTTGATSLLSLIHI